MITIAEYARNTGVSYQAVKQMIGRCGDEIKLHIVKEGAVSYLDDIAVSILSERRARNASTSVYTADATQQLNLLKAENERLRDRIIALQSDMLKDKAITSAKIEDLSKRVLEGIEGKQEMAIRDGIQAAQISSLKADLERAEGVCTEREAEIAALKAEIDTIKAKKWWQMIFQNG